MSHRRLLEDQIIALLGAGSRYEKPWHSEDELEDFLVRRGFDRDLILEVLDSMIQRGAIDFTMETTTGDYLISPPTDPSCYSPSIR